MSGDELDLTEAENEDDVARIALAWLIDHGYVSVARAIVVDGPIWPEEVS